MSENERLLVLMRHAKAVDRLEAEDDFQRGLTARGRSDSQDAAQALVDLGVSCEIALVSPSWRTRQTFEALREPLGDPQLDDPMALYHASTEMLERAVLGAFDRASSVIVVGHNPGIGGFAHKLARICDAARSLPAGYPTASATVFRIAGPGLENPQFAGIHCPKDF